MPSTSAAGKSGSEMLVSPPAGVEPPSQAGITSKKDSAEKIFPTSQDTTMSKRGKADGVQNVLGRVDNPCGGFGYRLRSDHRIPAPVARSSGIAVNPGGAWMEQMARNLVDALDGSLLGNRYLLLDRNPLQTQAFRRILDQAGAKTVRLPAHSPNLNALAERFVLSIKSECLDRRTFG